jgi:hypothetical protein
MPTPSVYVPGQVVLISGIYAELDRSGLRTLRNATCTKGEVFPPTRDNGYGWVLLQRTNP